MSELQIHVGESREQTAARFVDAWRRAERGGAVDQRHLSFDSFETMTRAITPKRLELLRHLHRTPEVSVAALARAVKRDYKRVHEDVEALTDVRLIERAEGGAAPSARDDAIQTTIALA